MELDFGKGIKTPIVEIYRCLIESDQQLKFAKKSIEELINHAMSRGFLLQSKDPYILTTHKPSGERFVMRLYLQYNSTYVLEFSNNIQDNYAGKSIIEMSDIGKLSIFGEITLAKKTK